MEMEVSNEQLVVRVRAGADVAENMLQLWKQCKGFVATYARKYIGAAEMDDLMQEGYIAISEAVEAYDSERGKTFISYAAFFIKRRMALCCQSSSSVRLPIGMSAMVREYRRLISDFRAEYDREPSDRELRALLGVSPKQLNAIREAERTRYSKSFDSPLDGEEDISLGDVVPDSVNVESAVLDEVQQEELTAAIWPLVEALDAEQAAVIRAKYRDGMTWAEIAERLGLSPSQAAAREKKGLQELRRPSCAAVLRPYLDEYIATRAYSGNGLGAFNRTWTSSTERVALQLLEKAERTSYTRGDGGTLVNGSADNADYRNITAAH